MMDFNALVNRLRASPVCVSATSSEGDPVGDSVPLSLVHWDVRVDRQFVLDMLTIELEFVTDGPLLIPVHRRGLAPLHPGLILMAAPDHPLYSDLDGMSVPLHFSHTQTLNTRFPVLARVQGPPELFDDLLYPRDPRGHVPYL